MGAKKGPIRDSQIQDWQKATAFLGYDEEGAGNPCLISAGGAGSIASFARRTAISSHKTSMSRTATVVSGAELNRIAESYCANEPAGRVGQRKPCNSVQVAPKGQSTYEWWCSRGEQSWMVQKASRSDTSPPNSPRSTGGLARDAWRGIMSPNHNLLAAGKRRHRGREWGGSALHTVSPRAWEPRGKGNCSFFENVGTGTEWNYSPPALPTDSMMAE